MTDFRIAEIHSSDLTATCLKRRRLVLEGKRSRYVGTAIYRGLLWHAFAEALHRWQVKHEGHCNIQEHDFIARLMNASIKVGLDLREQGLVYKGEDEAVIHEVACWAKGYIAVVMPTLADIEILGIESPIRWELGSGKPPFVSHLDMIFRDPDGVLHVWDWKTGEEAPTPAYLARNLQLACYSAAAKHGSVRLDNGEWIEFDEVPKVSWIHVRHCAPYKRAGSKVEEDGLSVTYKKGDYRPLDKIVFDVPTPDMGVLYSHLEERWKLMRDDIWPANPSPIGCQVCEARNFCDNLGTVTEDDND